MAIIKTDSKTVTSGVTVRMIRASEIFADYDWNSRSGDWASATSPKPEEDEKTGFAGFKLDVGLNGIKQPITCRPLPKLPNGATLSVVCGFRRFRAAVESANDTGISLIDLMIPVIVRTMNEQEALALNISENTQREDLRSVDTAVAVSKLLATGMSQKDAGILCGIGQTYAGKLDRIVKMDPRIVAHWRVTAIPLGVAVMDDIERAGRLANESGDLLLARYMEAVNPTPKAAKAADVIEAEKLARAKTAVEKCATLLGALHRAELLDVGSLDWINSVPHFFKGAEDFTDGTIEDLADAAMVAFQIAVTGIDPREAEKTASREAKKVEADAKTQAKLDAAILRMNNQKLAADEKAAKAQAKLDAAIAKAGPAGATDADSAL
jgi:ParB family chromosome partitioning protein